MRVQQLPQYPYSVVFDDPEYNIYYNVQKPKIFTSKRSQSTAINAGIKYLEKICEQQKVLEKNLLGDSTTFSRLLNIDIANEKFVKHFRKLFGILSTAENREDRIKALELLLHLTNHTLKSQNINENDLNAINKELSIIAEHYYKLNNHKRENEEKAMLQELKGILDTLLSSAEKTLTQEEAIEQIEKFIPENAHIWTEDATDAATKKFNDIINSRAGYAFEVIINKSKISQLQEIFTTDDGWIVTGSNIDSHIRAQYVRDDKTYSYSTTRNALDRIDEIITLTHTGNNTNQVEKYTLAFSDKLRIDTSNIEIQDRTSLLQIRDLLEKYQEHLFRGPNYLNNFIFLALNSAYASKFHDENDNFSLFINKVLRTFLTELIFNPKNFVGKILQEKNPNVLYFTQLGPSVIPSYTILEQAIQTMQNIITNKIDFNNKGISSYFSPDTTPLLEYKQEISNANYLTKKHNKKIYSDAAWRYVAYQVQIKSKVALSLDANILTETLFPDSNI